MEQPQKTPAKEKGSEAKHVRALGRRRTSLDHTPEKADSARCRGSFDHICMWQPSYLEGALWVSFLNYCVQSLSVNVSFHLRKVRFASTLLAVFPEQTWFNQLQERWGYAREKRNAPS